MVFKEYQIKKLQGKNDVAKQFLKSILGKNDITDLTITDQKGVGITINIKKQENPPSQNGVINFSNDKKNVK